MGEYLEHLFALELNNWGEFEQFLNSHRWPKLTQDETDYYPGFLYLLLNLSTTFQKQSLGPDGVTSENYQMFTDKVTRVPHK